MTGVPPEQDGGYGDSYGERLGGDPYGRPYGRRHEPDSEREPEPARRHGEFQAAVDALHDPLTDPLPGQSVPDRHPRGDGIPAEYVAHEQGPSPWFQPHREPEAAPVSEPEQARWQGASPSPAPPVEGYYGGGHDPYGSGQHGGPEWQGQGAVAEPELGSVPRATAGRQADAAQSAPRAPAPQLRPEPLSRPEPGDGSRISETAALPVVDVTDAPGADPAPHDDDTGTVGLRRPDADALAGRAARRRAAQRRGRGAGARDTAPPPVGTRLEARRAARARREGPAIIASRFLGEVFISAGVLMLLFVAYQLWWTNVLAGQEAGGATKDLQEQWKHGGGGKPDAEHRAGQFAPGQGFALIYIPKLDIKTPIAQGVSKPQVLDKGMVGHYDKAPFKTAMPWDRKGNFALAGHRNTHGEPFRYINRLVAGDEVVVETATKFYTYKMTSRLPYTPPSNTRVIEPVPPQSGFKKPGRYITLTTCTPEFTSKARLIVWGKMVEERPRSKGKPDALVG